MTEEKWIQEVWRECFSALLNYENPNVIQEECCVERPVTDISEENVELALRAMKANKALGTSLITSDIFKFAGRTGKTHITKVFQQIMHSELCPEKWEDSITLPFWKGKCDPLQSGKSP